MKESEIEYQKELQKFAKYRKNGVDLAFRCDRCGKLVLQVDILYGIVCRRCGSRRVCPITINLTKFGVLYCRFWNWFYEQRYIKKFGTI